MQSLPCYAISTTPFGGFRLKPGGTAILIVPDGLMNQSAVLSYTRRQCLVRGIISLPVRTFYSTPKKTYILILERKYRETEEQTDPVFAYLVSEIGETRDARRWHLNENDLTEATAFYNQFKGSPATFRPPGPGSGGRCKVLPFSEFKHQTHWMADRWWSPEECYIPGSCQRAPCCVRQRLPGSRAGAASYLGPSRSGSGCRPLPIHGNWLGPRQVRAIYREAAAKERHDELRCSRLQRQRL